MWTLGDRLAKSRETAGISAQHMGEILGVNRTTISNYEHDRTRVPRAVVLVWATETGVDPDWLLDPRSRCIAPLSIVVGQLSFDDALDGLAADRRREQLRTDHRRRTTDLAI